MSRVIKYFECTIRPSYFSDKHTQLEVRVKTTKDQYTYQQQLYPDSFESDLKRYLNIVELQIRKILENEDA